MLRLFKIPTLWVLLIASMGCQEETIVPDTSRLGADFFPMEKGLYWEYEVDLTTYNLLDSMPSHYFLREVVADTFTDLSGSLSYRLERFSRETANVDWQLDSVWTARLSTTQAVRIENNVPFIKLTFPLAEGKEWNGNALNNRGEETYQVSGLGLALEVGDTTFENTLTILQREVLDTIVFQDVRREYFAKEIGLVKKEFIQLNYCSTEECFGQKIIDSGRKLYMELVAHGKE
ncbi:MAG: hypothetical protein ACMVP2_26295 [Imperialibacter sp.]|uniref:hypothetical protein n=1 Tax=Imperialibacter sp. TaxID=2038411 RepID=UPI003A88C104